MVADAAQKSKGGIKAPLIEVVKKQAADAARFLAMLEMKILVTPAFEARVYVFAEGLAGTPGLPVPGDAILAIPVVCLLYTSPSPRDRG